MLVTDSTSSSGLTGHAGIVVDCGGYVASIKGDGYNPELMSISTWFSKYPDERVVRYSNATAASNAGSWARSYVINYSTAPYVLSKLYYMNSTYCSKIVWDSFFYGANINFNNHDPYGPNLFFPYSIDDNDYFVIHFFGIHYFG